ncbi:MAG: NAD(P)-binding domain-containing protein [Chitinophagales bacterium]|nr:NAD(P)-binding domain-containing protein [Chitinophagales bacterium]
MSNNVLGKIGLIGNGSWGTAIAKILTDNGHSIHWWVRNEEAANSLQTRYQNPHYLTSVRFLPETITPTNDLEEVLSECTTVIVCVPSAYVQGVIESVDPKLWADKNVVSAIKGILPDSNLLLNDYMSKNPSFNMNRYMAVTGPCHAEEVADERISYLTFSGLNDELTTAMADAFRNTYIYATTNHDIWGVQFAAVLKNIYAVGAGMAHALDYGDNFLSVYITNCYREMYRYLDAHFRQVHPSDEHPDFHTSAYLGDLLVTCYSLHSRNRMLGTMLGKGYSVRNAILEMNMVAEGYYAARGMQHIAKEYKIDIPIATAIYDVLWNHRSPAETFLDMEKTLS